jgi:hypothetical protein
MFWGLAKVEQYAGLGTKFIRDIVMDQEED